MVGNLLDMDKLKEIEVDLFKVFINICQNNNLRYFATGGTLLGAVRHNGFIPWDDDIDVAMPRPDYEKFIKLAQKELPDYIFLQTAKSNPDYPMNFAKLRNENTTFIESSIKDIKTISHGVYIDIFPLDGYSESKWFDIKDKILKKRMSLLYNVKEEENVIRKILCYFLRNIIYPDYHTVRDKKEALYKSRPYESSEYIQNYSGAWGKKEVGKRAWFDSIITVKFENIDISIPKGYDQYLKHLYGDYMKLPPVEDRVAHHFCEVIDLTKSYKMYINNN